MSSRSEDDAAYYARLLEAAVKAGTVAAVALPAVGVACRWISFSFGGVPPELAIADTLPALAYRGAGAMWLAVVWIVVVSLLLPFRPSDEASRKSRQPGPLERKLAGALGRPIGWVSATPWLALGFPVVSFGFLAVFYPMGLIPVLLGQFFSIVVQKWAAQPNRTGFRTVAPMLLIAMGLLTVWSGVTPPRPEAVYVRPVATAELPRAGWYNLLGRADGWVYGWECARAHVIAAPDDAIAGSTFERLPRTPEEYSTATIMDLLSGSRRVGFRPNCPGDVVS